MKTKFNPWPFGIVLVFVVFIGGMATAVTIACTHREHLVSENYYEQELNFQNKMESAARAEKSGAKIAGEVSGAKILIQLPVAQLAQNFSGKIELYRPSAPELDQRLTLQPANDGTQTVDVSKLAAGAWAVRVSWNAGGENYFLEQKIKI
jgi:hypothetical protein